MFENNLKFCRETLELTQKELGTTFGVSRKTISGWENNNDIIPLPQLIKFCNIYNFSVDYVMGLTRKNVQYNSKIVINQKELGLTLRNIRKKLHLTQIDISNECAISNTTYSNYELGITLISTMSLYTICKNHKLSADEILRNKISND